MRILICLHQVSSLLELLTGRQYVGWVGSFEEMASSATVSRLVVSWLREIDLRSLELRLTVVRFILCHDQACPWEGSPNVAICPTSRNTEGEVPKLGLSAEFAYAVSRRQTPADVRVWLRKTRSCER